MKNFISFEGGEGCGKTLQSLRLAERLRGQGFEVVHTKEPGGCPIANGIRALLLDPQNEEITPTTELLLYAAARAQHVEEVVRPALQRGAMVICDRFADSTRAYQGIARGLDMTTIEDLNRIATKGLEPGLTLLLDLPVEQALSRAMHRNGADCIEGRFEQEALSFHQAVKFGFDSLAQAYPDRICRIHASGTPEIVEQRVWAATEAFVSNK